jgi:hypothetical protein
VETSFIGGGNRNTRRKPSACRESIKIGYEGIKQRKKNTTLSEQFCHVENLFYMFSTLVFLFIFS